MSEIFIGRYNPVSCFEMFLRDNQWNEELIPFICIYRTWASHTSLGSELTTSHKLAVVSLNRRANTSTQYSDDVGARVSCFRVSTCDSFNSSSIV